MRPVALGPAVVAGLCCALLVLVTAGAGVSLAGVGLGAWLVVLGVVGLAASGTALLVTGRHRRAGAGGGS